MLFFNASYTVYIVIYMLKVSSNRECLHCFNKGFGKVQQPMKHVTGKAESIENLPFIVKCSLFDNTKALQKYRYKKLL